MQWKKRMQGAASIDDVGRRCWWYLRIDVDRNAAVPTNDQHNDDQHNDDHELLFGRWLIGFRCDLLLPRARGTVWHEVRSMKTQQSTLGGQLLKDLIEEPDHDNATVAYTGQTGVCQIVASTLSPSRVLATSNTTIINLR